jgi:hypothetical protein
MTRFAWDVPGYVQGHRFSDGARYWDEATGRFRDLAGYDHIGNYVELVGGTPAFSTHGANERTGLLLDNATTFKFHTAVPWEGSMLFVVKPTTPSASVTQYPWLFGNAPSETSNGNIRLAKSGGVTSLSALTPSVLIVNTVTPLTSGDIGVAAFSFNQSDRYARSTKDGVTITELGPEAGANGNPVAIGAVSSPGVIADIGGISHDYVRMGDNVGDGSLTPNATDYLHVFEQHFWKGDVILDYPDELAGFIADLEEFYGI